ncbi:MAG: hypothetical protein ACR2PK_12425, partial [Acidimicrobiales bacterium]
RYRAFGARMDEPYFLGLVAEAAMAVDEPDTALNVLDEAEAIVAETTRTFFFEAELARLRAVAVARRGDVEAARAILQAAADMANRFGAIPYSLRIELTRNRLGLARRSEEDAHHAELTRLISHYDGRLSASSTPWSFADLDEARRLTTG